MNTPTDRIHTFGRAMLERYVERVHKIALDAGFTCPNRDGSKGIGGCTFCNNKSFHPQGVGRGSKADQSATTTLASGTRNQVPLVAQFDRARGRIARGIDARRFIARSRPGSTPSIDQENGEIWTG